MKIDIIGSIIITIVLMFVAHIFDLGFFGCILLMLGSLLVLRYWGRVKGYWYRFTSKFEKRSVSKKVRSSYERMSIDDID